MTQPFCQVITDRAQAKAKAEMARRSNARKAKQQMDTEQETEILRKLDGLSELSGIRKDIRRIAVALEKLAGMKGEDSDKEQILQLESKGELMEVQGSREKGKQKEERVDGAEEEEETKRQEEETGMEGVEEGGGDFFPVA